METVVIPDYIDELPQFLLWETDEIAPMMIMFMIGIITQTLTFTIIPAYLVTKLYQRYKAEHLAGHLIHLGYRIGIFPLNRRFENGATTDYHI